MVSAVRLCRNNGHRKHLCVCVRLLASSAQASVVRLSTPELFVRNGRPLAGGFVRLSHVQSPCACVGADAIALVASLWTGERGAAQLSARRMRLGTITARASSFNL